MVKVAALYHFHPIDDVKAFKQFLELSTSKHNVMGMLIIASEGINGTIAAEDEQLTAFIVDLLADIRWNGMQIKYSYALTQPFYHMRITIRKEIVTMGIDGFTLAGSEAITLVEPAAWNAVLSMEDVVIVDTRNDYEVHLGSFTGAINPQTDSFKDFPRYVKEQLDGAKDKPIAVFCTGGIRCEKAACYLAQQGYKSIYNLKGGILNYLEHIPAEDSQWQGECFVFDQRVSVIQGLDKGNSVLCRGCRRPLLPIDRVEHYVEGVHCRYCYDTMTADKIHAAEERDLQIKLAIERNEKHLGYVHPAHSNSSAHGNNSSCETSSDIVGEVEER